MGFGDHLSGRKGFSAERLKIRNLELKLVWKSTRPHAKSDVRTN